MGYRNLWLACMIAGGSITAAAVVSSGGEPLAAEALPDQAASAGPPEGKYVCRQYMTTMGFLTLLEGSTYEVSGVEGEYRYDVDTGEIEWLSGSYHEWGWPARYDYRSAASLERPQDEHIVRMTDDTGKLKIDCFLMRP